MLRKSKHRSDTGGFTLVEVMVAMGIALIALMGLLQALDVVSARNLQNQRRDEAVQVAEDWMNRFRTVPFNALSTAYTPLRVPSRLRGGVGNYTVIRSTVMAPDNTAALLSVRVRWRFKNISTTHEVNSVRSNLNQ